MKKTGTRMWAGLALAVWAAGCAPKDAAPRLVVGMSVDRPPLAARGAAGVEGFEAAVAQAIAAQAGLPLEIRELAADELLPALAAGKVDLVLAGWTPTAERAAVADFSAPYHDATLVALMVAGNPVAEARDDLKALRLGALAGSRGEAEAAALVPADRLARFETPSAAAVRLLEGQLDAVILDAQQGDHLRKKHSLLMPLRLAEFAPEMRAVAVRKGDAARLALVNETLAALAADGRHAQFVERWLAPSADVPEF